MDIKPQDVGQRKPIKVFCCYARKDQQYLLDLKVSLMPMQRSGLITLWADVDIDAGAEWEKAIRLHLNTAHIILLLVSPDFLASEYCAIEMQHALERHKRGEARVIPIILRLADWRETPLGELQALPKDAQPITRWQDRDEAFNDIARRLRDEVKLVEKEQRHQPEEEEQSGQFAPSESASANPLVALPEKDAPRLGWLYSQSKHFREYLSTKIILTIPALVLIVLSFPDLLKSVPLFEWMSSYPVTTPIIGGALVLLFLPLLIISFAPEPQNSRKVPITKKPPKWIIATTLATTGFLLSSLLLAVALIRPPGCPTVFCAEIVPQVVTNPQGVHDANLEAFLITKPQSPFFMIPGNPAQYTQTDLPQSIGAVRLDGKPSVSFYRIVIGIHSLQQGLYGVTITHVGLEILQTPATPRPLNVWNQGLPQDYHTNPYLAVYNGELPGSVIPATYTPSPLANVSLLPGEPDQLDIQVNSHVLAYIQFRVQITYRVTNLSQTHLLTLPNSFEVIFSNALNWNTYQNQEGHFVRSP